MPLASEHFRALKEEIDIQNLKSVDETASALRKTIADTQQLTLSQLNDSTTRQLGSILFSHEAGLISALSAFEAPKVKWEKNKKLSLSHLFFLISFLMAAACCALAWEGDKKLLAVLFAAAEIFGATAFFWPQEKPKATVNQEINADALFLLAERRMEAIDRDMEAFLSLPSGSADEDEGVLHLITKVVSMKREDPECIPDEIMTSITALSIARGYQMLDYTEEYEMYFDVMPTKRETRTIVPALLKNEKLLARGMAIHHVEETSEEE